MDIKRESLSGSATAKRQSNIELLRILAMITIVAHHFGVHGGFDLSADSVSFNRIWIQILSSGGRAAVNIFVLISGYFLINTPSIQIGKAAKLWLQIFFYSLIIYVFFVISGIIPFSSTELIQHVLPITYRQWWFATDYFVLFLISPFLNILLKSLSDKQYLHLLGLLTVIWCVLPTLTARNVAGNSFTWFVYIYALAGYIKLHYNKPIEIKKPALIIFAVVICLFTFTVLIDYISISIPSLAVYATYLYDMNMVPTLIFSVLVFLVFINLNIQYHPFINILSSATFGVYLIHDCSIVREYIWGELFKLPALADDNLLWIKSLLIIVVVYCICTIIELLRINLIERIYINKLYKSH